MKKILPILIIVIPLSLFAMQKEKTVTIQWQALQSEKTLNNKNITWISFKNAFFRPDYGSLPFYQYNLNIAKNKHLICTVKPLEWDTLDNKSALSLSDEDIIGNDFVILTTYSSSSAQINVLPMKKTNNKIIRLIKFSLNIKTTFSSPYINNITNRKIYKTSSVLSSGRWFKLGINKTGVYKISYNDFVNMGWDPDKINPDEIKIYGNYMGLLPESNRYYQPDDLEENAISVIGGEDGSFNQGDVVLFFARGPVFWRYNPFTGRYDHQMNIYSDTTWYFLTVSQGEGKRIKTEESVNATPTKTVNNNYEYQVHEIDRENLLSSGKEWFGEELSGDTMQRNFHFHFDGLKNDKAVFLKFEMAARSSQNTYYKLFVNNKLIIDSTLLYKILPQTSIFAHISTKNITFFSNSDDLNVSVRYYSNEPNSVAWINYIAFNVICNLQFNGKQMRFSAPHAAASGNIIRYVMATTNKDIKIWDITNHTKVKNIAFQWQSNNLQFTVPNDSLREFFAFEDNNYYIPIAFRRVPNQDLHKINRVDMVIIAPPVFKEQAERLAKFHTDFDSLKCVVVEPNEIYNEFSSGSQDISAIRNFMRMLYEKNAFDGKPGYLLLFGDASFDYRNRLPNNTNFVPTYESAESLRETGSFVTDDYFGLLDKNEGINSSGNLEIGIGRFPVSTVEEATTAVDKVEYYTKHTKQVMRNWRNQICFVADDGNENLHLHQAEQLSSIVDTAYPFLNENKIYSDAFPKIKIPEGYRFPEVNKRINEQIENGTLIINYTGHGGLIGWSDEAILDVPAIRSFTNIDNLPLFITATCEFSRFDNPNFKSAGEYTFLNRHGGAISLLTTTRLAYAHANIVVNMRIYSHLIERENGMISRFGDMIRLSKIPSSINFLNFTLLGDPALRLAIPVDNVITTKINSIPIKQYTDSIHALSKITVEGEIQNEQNLKINNFNGVVSIKVFDKPTKYTTLGSDNSSYPEDFFVQDKELFKGKASVTNGVFTFSFVVPKDISYQYGFGKISYYALDTITMKDAKGAYRKLMIGSITNNFTPETQGPDISLFIDTKDFISGGITSANPILIAEIYDKQGINSTGNSLGRDMVFWLDNDKSTQQTVNKFFSLNINSYQKGTLTYQLHNLSEGHHSLTFKAWNVQNKSSEKTIEFRVIKSGTLSLSNVKCYPNPFTESVKFSFNHNKPGQFLNVDISIFTMQGRLIKEIKQNIATIGKGIKPIVWNGKNNNGKKLLQGFYFYRLIVTDNEGNRAVRAQKFIKINQ